MIRTLDVYVDDTLVGQLTDESNIWVFEYARSWLVNETRYPLSPHIPLREGRQVDEETFRPVQWFFENLLPEEKARTLLAKDVRVPVEDGFELLNVAGAESAGAITLMPKGEKFASGTALALTHEEMNKRINNLSKSPLNRAEPKRMSVAGAQHKMLVIYRNGELLEPSGSVPSTHILKPEHASPDLYYYTVRNEWFVMKLAKQCGLNTPSVDIRYLPEPVYLIERFDRIGQFSHRQRCHVLDGCQLLNLASSMKYAHSTAANLRKLAQYSRMKAQTALDIFRWAVFNALVGNGDAHLKNLSFFIKDADVIMTPHYDLLSTAIYEAPHKHMDHELSYPMGEAQFLGELSEAHIMAFAEELNVPASLAARQLREMAKVILKNASYLVDVVKAVEPHPGKAGEVRMVNEILHNCIKETIKNLRL